MQVFRFCQYPAAGRRKSTGIAAGNGKKHRFRCCFLLFSRIRRFPNPKTFYYSFPKRRVSREIKRTYSEENIYQIWKDYYFRIYRKYKEEE